MGKEGPCCHCGVTSTPLWRNGPPEKPVLCNACGSRWRTKGTLKNYMPLHAKIEPDEYEDNRAIKVKSTFLKKNDEPVNRKRLYYESTIGGVFTPDQSEVFQKNLDEDTSNRSSSGSAISNSESCAQFGGTDASNLTGPTQSIVWDALVPSRKRTCITHPKQSSVEKLTKDLYSILHEQSSLFSSYPEDELLFESEVPLVSVEIGHGSVLIRHPSSMAQEEESEASSFSRVDEGYSNVTSLLSFSDTKGASSFSRVEQAKKLNGQVMCLEQIKREGVAGPEKLRTLWTHNSPLCHINLSEHLQKEDRDFNPRNLFAMHADHGALMLDSFRFKEENSDHDLLLDIPSNGSFPQAELLRPASCFASQQACTSSNSIH